MIHLYHIISGTVLNGKNITIEETLQIALDAHKGQKDLDGKPAILHPVAVGIMGSNDAEIKAGFLHDVIEDSELTIDDLRNKGVDEEVLDVTGNQEYIKIGNEATSKIATIVHQKR